MSLHTSLVLLNAADGGPPSEFRIFRRGINTSMKGDVLFDDTSATNVMANYAQHGVDAPIDLEHLSLDTESASYDPDARGWFGLELRDGELWAVNVRWTPDGERRLREKTQRYISPAFHADKDNRVHSILNAALTSLPATDQPHALIAANQLRRFSNMDPEMIKAALAALSAEDGEAALKLLAEAIAAAAGAEVEPEPEDEPADSEATAPADPTALAEDTDEDKQDEEEKLSAFSQVVKLTASTTPAEALETVTAWSKRIAEVEVREVEIDLAERVTLTSQLVKLGAELPSTAWEGDASKKKPVQRLLSEDIAGLRKRVQILSAAKNVRRLTPPTKDSGVVKLSQAELAACKSRNIDPETFAARKAAAVKRTAL